MLADDLHYVGGDWYFLDMYSGMKVRASKARRQWDNVITSGSHFSPRQPQDMVQGVRDDQAVPWALPRQVNQFTVIATFVTAFAGRGNLSMQVDSAVGFQIGDRCQVPLDDGNLFTFTLSGIVGNVLSWASPGLPGTVGGSFGDPLENQVFNLGPNNSAPP